MGKPHLIIIFIYKNVSLLNFSEPVDCLTAELNYIFKQW